MYLYGASIQGIQGFIFATNKLQEIIGASEIIKSINEDFIKEIKKYGAKLIMSAAGNMKAVFNSRDDLQKFIRDFAKKTQKRAYGITISEAVVKIDDDEPTSQERTELENRLKIQRNRPSIPIDLSLNITKLSPSSAKPLYTYSKKNEPLDKSAWQKRVQYNIWFKEKLKENPNFKDYKELKDISNDKNKIAVIHIDGNGLGALLMKLKEPISKFSAKLDSATKTAFKKAKKDSYKLRDVILGGDDVTVICDANVALKFTKDFLQYFEEETEKSVGKLTACAGIAICNEKYPFHYAIELAEELCSQSKKDAKKINEELAPSCLMFHNIQSSSFQSWEKIVKDELTINNIRCDFGPYYLNETDKPKIDDLLNLIDAFRADSISTGKFRSYLTTLYKNSFLAKEELKRIDEVLDSNTKTALNNALSKLHCDLSITNLIIDNKTPLYDILQITSNTTKGKK